jgi:DNA replication protein DnaC
MPVGSEWDDRKNKTIARFIKMAGFRYKASLKQMDYPVERGLDKNEVHRLASLDFIKEHKDLFITGSTGTGKSYLATALGFQAGWDTRCVMLPHPNFRDSPNYPKLKTLTLPILKG